MISKKKNFFLNHRIIPTHACQLITEKKKNNFTRSKCTIPGKGNIDNSRSFISNASELRNGFERCDAASS